MIIEDVDALNTWLITVLKPICEADPNALAKYVIALVKKDKTPEAMRQSMVNQLEVFLQTETEPFVSQLFKVLESQNYILPPMIPNTNPPNPVAAAAAVALESEASNNGNCGALKAAKTVIPVAEIAASISETLNGKSSSAIAKDERKDEKKEGRRRSRRKSLSKGRSRSRSWDRKRSRSRDKSRERDSKYRGGPRNWRNKSPSWRRRSGSPADARRSRSRSPRHNHRGRYRNRSPPASSRSRSRSPSPGNNSPEAEKNPAVASTVVVQRKRRCRDYDEKGFCMQGELCPFDHGVDPVVLEDTALSRVLYAPNAPPARPEGLLGPPPRGMPGVRPMAPVAAEYNPQAPQMWHRGPPPAPFRGAFRGPPPRMGMMPMAQQQQRELISVPVMENNFSQQQQQQQQQQHQQPPPFGFPYQQQQHQHQQQMRHHNNGLNNDFGVGPMMAAGGGGGKKFDFNRLGPRQKNNCSLELKKVPPGLNNITHLNNHFSKFGKIVNIQVFYEGDPEAAIVTFSSHAEAHAAYRSTEAVLNNRFIKMFWHSGNTHPAPQLPPPPNNNNETKAAENVGRGNVKDRLGLKTAGGNLDEENERVNEEDAENAVPGNKMHQQQQQQQQQENKINEIRAIKKNQELLLAKEKLKKNQEEKRKEAIKLKLDLRKRKQDLLEKQLAQQKLLIEKMEKCPPGEQRDLLMQTIKKSQESIEAIRKDLSQNMAMGQTKATAAAAMAVTVKQSQNSREMVQKELLDAELDLMTKQAEGADTVELQKRLWELRARAGKTGPAVGPLTAARGGRGGSRRFNPLLRQKITKVHQLSSMAKTAAAANKALAVDHRPKTLLVSGYEADEMPLVMIHLAQFGSVVETVIDEATPSVLATFKSRKEAEVAFVKGKHFQDRTLSVTWCERKQQNVAPTAVNANAAAGITEERAVVEEVEEEDEQGDISMKQAELDEDDRLMEGIDGEEEGGPEISEEVLLQDDEEDDEENEEDRSWRR